MGGWGGGEGVYGNVFAIFLVPLSDYKINESKFSHQNS